MPRDFRQVSVGCLDAVRESDSTPTAQRTAARLNSFVPILENAGHTYPVSVAEWPGSRTYRRAYSATQWFEPHLSGIIGIALWRYVLSAVSMLGPLMSHGLAVLLS